MAELVDLLAPPDFHKSGQVKTKVQALKDGDWLGVLNFWIVQDKPFPAIIYQQRSPQSRWGPNLLDVTVGGYYQQGETIQDGLREAQEELGKAYNLQDLTLLGRKLFFGIDTRGNHMKSVVDVLMTLDNTPINQFTLEKEEVYALVMCPIDKLLSLHQNGTAFTAKGINNTGKPLTISVTPNLIPYNWDNYHFKIALLARRFLNGEKNLIY